MFVFLSTSASNGSLSFSSIHCDGNYFGYGFPSEGLHTQMSDLWLYSLKFYCSSACPGILIPLLHSFCYFWQNNIREFIFLNIVLFSEDFILNFHIRRPRINCLVKQHGFRIIQPTKKMEGYTGYLFTKHWNLSLHFQYSVVQTSKSRHLPFGPCSLVPSPKFGPKLFCIGEKNFGLNGFQTHSARQSHRHHWHNVKNCQSEFRWRSRCGYVWTRLCAEYIQIADKKHCLQVCNHTVWCTSQFTTHTT